MTTKNLTLGMGLAFTVALSRDLCAKTVPAQSPPNPIGVPSACARQKSWRTDGSPSGSGAQGDEVTLNGSWPGGRESAHDAETSKACGPRPWSAAARTLQLRIRRRWRAGTRPEQCRDSTRQHALQQPADDQRPSVRDAGISRIVPHGSVEQIWHSGADPAQEPAPYVRLSCRRSYRTNPSRKYPVLYLLHGGGGDEDSWTTWAGPPSSSTTRSPRARPCR